ncbi:MAG: hypothetical protein C4293_03405 [Nitrospiraceae bacterium]
MWKKAHPTNTVAREGETEYEDSAGSGEESMGLNQTRGRTMEKKEEDVVAFVGKGVNFKGMIIYDGAVRIDGCLEGEIQTEGMLIVGDTATITAKITAGSVVSHGKIKGDIAAKGHIQLRAPAVLEGSVKTPVFSIEDGVVFNGTCEMNTANETAKTSEVSIQRLPEGNIALTTGGMNSPKRAVG